MSAVRGRGNRTTETRLRMGLVRAGISGWVSHAAQICGKPDFYFPAARLAVFVDGCFWHGCKDCGHVPKTNQAFWAAKIERNRRRHREVAKKLTGQRIKVLRFWEHKLKEDLSSCVSSISETNDREMRLAAARASLKESWRRAEAAGLDPITDEEIDREIAEVRAEHWRERPLQ